MDTKKFHIILRNLREERGLSVKGLSEAMGISETLFELWENGTAMPTQKQAEALAKELGVEPEDLTYTSEKFKINTKYFDEEQYTQAEKDRMFEEYKNGEIIRYNQGKKIVRTIIIIEAILSVASSVLRLNILSLILSAVILICLWNGRPWAKYVYVANGIINALTNMFIIGTVHELNLPTVIVFVIVITYSIATSVIMMTNRSVHDFLYEQYAG